MGEEQEFIEQEEATESLEESTEATGEAEEQTEETGTEQEEEGSVPIGVQKRIDKLTARAKTAEEKFQLFRTDPEAYYQQYPDERPAQRDPEPEPTPIPQSIRDVADMVVSGGPYNGKTFAEVYREDPYEAQALYDDYRNTIRAEQEAKEGEERAFQEEADRFKASISKQMYGDGALTPDQEKEVLAVQQQTAKWMLDNNRLFLSMDEAYFLMNRDAIIKGEQVKGINALAAALGDDVPAVSGGKGDGGEVSGFSGMAGMSRAQIAARVADMSDGNFRKFLREAPAAVRKKCPDLPWD